ncbi:hypothetical protein POV27_07705 [Aureisphaera galaxeae]|uniref:hypothetical protein n=1 Tax=Aureisphaera galaxeae TaxID=1538023 RepID=UPI00235066C0|nr:hypothetical protein [Aureisphaera galaxeae]MDC8003933.1 hypothetical protein [Aureisphaera galaxeae]
MIRIITFIFGISFTLVLFANCSSDNRNITVNSIKEIDSVLSPSRQFFEIKADKEAIVKGAKGTTIYIPENTFQFVDGTAPVTPIKITLKESYSLSEMIFENLHTLSGDRILETNGMIYVTAEADGQQLSVREGSAIVIGFPKNGSEEEMDLFYDFQINDSTQTWIPDYQLFEANALAESIRETDTLSEGGDEAFQVTYPIEMTDDLYDYHFWVSLRTATFDEIKLLGRDETIIDYLRNPENIDSATAYSFYTNNWRADFDLHIDEKGNMFNFRPNKDIGLEYDEEAIKIAKELFESVPAFDVDAYERDLTEGWDYALGIMGGRSINWSRFKQKFRNKYSDYTDKAVEKMDANTLQYFVFSATELGWINCDRFLDLDDTEKTDFIVNTAHPKDTKVQIVFKDIKSIMNGRLENGNILFGSVPKGKSIQVIGISHANGKPTMTIVETTTDAKDFELTGFKEFTLDQLEAELNKLN